MVTQSTKSLLIVDDSPMIIERVIESLKDHEAIKVIFTASKYQEAIDLLHKHPIDFILLDIQLPGKSGIDLLKVIVIEYPSSKVIMYSNLLDDNYIKVCKKLGARYFLDKSKDFEMIPVLFNKI